MCVYVCVLVYACMGCTCGFLGTYVLYSVPTMYINSVNVCTWLPLYTYVYMDVLYFVSLMYTVCFRYMNFNFMLCDYKCPL